MLACENVIEHVASYLKLDPLAVRRLNLYNEGSNTYRKRGISMIPAKFGIGFVLKFLNQAGALNHVYEDDFDRSRSTRLSS